MVYLVVAGMLFLAFIILIRLFGAWMLRINEVISLLDKIHKSQLEQPKKADN